MLFQKISLISNFIIIYLFIEISLSKKINFIRFLNETNVTYPINETNGTNFTYGINDTNETIETDRLYEEVLEECSLFLDCFNCTIDPYCRWERSNESCIPFIPYNRSFSIPVLSKNYLYNDIDILNSHIYFIRKACFLPYNPFIENNNTYDYNTLSVKYCGEHDITNHLSNYSKEFLIELKDINGTFGLPNILCEYVILSGPNRFLTDIVINENESTNFYLLYSENSFYFYDLFNETTTLTIRNTGRRTNTFIYYGLKSFNSSPFKITFKENIPEDSDSQTVGYILIVLIIIIFIIIVASIIYIRCNSNLFKKDLKQKIIYDEEEKIAEKSNFSENNVKIIQNENLLNNAPNRKSETENIKYNINTQIEKDIYLEKKINKVYTYNGNKISKLNNMNDMDICCFDNEIIKNIGEKYIAKCGHKYHLQCFNKLCQDSMNVYGQLKLKCPVCQQIIYP